MKRNLLWALLSWLSLLSFGAQAQTVTLAQETFEDGTSGANPRYGYTTVVPFTPTSTRFFERKLVTNNSYTGLLGTATGAAIYGTEGTYLWAARSVRSTSSSNINSNAAAVLQLNDITATNYNNLRIVVAFADPSGTSRNTVVNAQRIRLQYSFDGSPWVTAGLIMGNSEQTQTSGYYQEDTAPLDSIPDGIVLNQTFQDITANINATGTTLRVRIVADTRLPQFVFDNVRVTGTVSAAPKPTLANLEATAASYTEAGSPVVATSTLTVGYSNNSATTLTGATVKVSANFVANQDRLTLPSPVGNITGSYSSSTGVLTLNGTDTQANYQTALRSVTYSNDNTTTLTSGTRQLSFQVYNGSAALSNTPVRTLNVTGVLNPPASLATPYVENFDSDGEGLRYFGNSFVSTAATAGFFRTTTSPATSGGSPIGNVTFTGWSGGYWYGENTKLNGVPTRTIQLAPVNAAGAAGLKFVIAVGSSSTLGSSASWNPGGYFKLYYRANGGSWTEFGSFTPDANGVLHRGGSADSAAIGPALRYVTFPLPTTAAVGNLDFQLTQLSDGDEELAFDNIRISAAVAPTVTTALATSITTTSAVLGGNVTANGNGTLTERGVVYVVGTGTPTVSNTKALVSTSGVTTGAFSGTVSGLSPGTTYTVRAYAINEAGPGYGASTTFTTQAPVGGTTVVMNVSCNGGTNGAINLTPSGGTAPYTFLWSPGGQTTEDRTGLAAGTYTVTITDANGATGTVSATVTQPSALTATTSQTNVTTNGGNNGSATITVSGGTPGYTYSWSPNVSTTATASNLSAGTYSVTATDANGCTIARSFTITQPAFTATAQNVTVQLDANGNGTLNASSVNNGSTGSGTLTYTIQKIAFGYIPESTTPLTLTTPNGANFTQIRFASYGTPNNSTSGNYSLGSCNAANSLAAAQNAYVGRSSGSMYANNYDSRNNPVLGDPCGGTPKALAVQAGYSADAASLTYDCTEAGKTQYVLLTVSNGTNTSTSVAQVTVNAPPTATISSVSPTAAQRGATVTVVGTNLSGVSSVTVNGAAATVSNLTSSGFTFVVPSTATFGTGSIVVATPCAQTLTNTFSVTAPALTATVSTTSASPTSTAPIPFSVTFSQSVGTTFIASDVTVANGTVTSGSFSGSGAGPYTFTVTPSALGTISVSLAASVAQDANNTGNSASNLVSVQFQAPTIVVAPASLPNGQQNTAYSQALSASGGTAPYTYAITNGALPSGLTLSSSGTIAGTPTTNGTFNFTVTATDASAAPGPYSGSRAYSLVINAQPATAAPVVTTPANNSFSNNRSVTVTGTAPAGSTVAIYIGGNLAGTTPASASGTFSYLIPGNAPDGTYVVSATAQSSGATTSPSSNGNTFTIDGTAPTAALSSGTVTSGGNTSTSPVSFTATFNEPVTGLTAAGLTVTNGTVTSGPTAGSGNTYTFQVTPSAAGTVTVQVAANAAQDQATNGNTASALYSFTFAAPTIAITPTTLPNGQQGTAYSQALSASGGTAPYTYSITNGALPAGLSLTNGTIAGTPTANGTFNFTVTARDASMAPGPYSGSQAYSLVIAAPAITATTWTGTISTDWFTAGNWTQGVPNATIDATIPTAPSGGRFPAISAGTANSRNLTFNSGATLNQSGGTLVIAANLTNNGTFRPTGGTVNLGNTTLSSVLGNGNIRFWNLLVGANGAQLSTSIGASVQRLLTLNGNFATNGNSFVLESNNTLTALVVNNNSNVVNGTVTVQRAIDPSVNSGLGYRHYSAPVSNSTVSDLATSGFTPVVNPAFNTVASPYTITPYPTVYGYDDSRLSLTNNLDMFDKGYFSPSALSDPLAVGKGYTVNIAASEVVDFQGTLNNGDLSLNLTSTRNTYPADGGWQFLGNPYPAPLDYSLVQAADRSGLESAIYVYSSTTQYQGRYRVYINGIGNPVVPMGQGYFTRVASGQSTANMTFRNSQRLTAPNGTTLQRTTADPRPLVQLTLQGQGAAPADEAYVYFENGATSGFEPAFDAEKLPNPTGFNLSTTQAGKQLSVDGQPELGTAQRVVPLAVGVPAAGVYTFTASQLLNLSATPVYLRDLQLGTLTDLRQQPTYQFTVSNAAALNTTRFALVFSPQQALATAPAALAEQVGLYPNPARTQVAIELPLSLSRQPVAATLLDALGRVVRQQALPAGLATHTMPLADLATGVYSLRLTTEKGTVVKKLVVE